MDHKEGSSTMSNVYSSFIGEFFLVAHSGLEAGGGGTGAGGGGGWRATCSSDASAAASARILLLRRERMWQVMKIMLQSEAEW